jgi:uncharacterized protein (TIGR02284 family)
MNNIKDDAISTLNNLIETCRDGQYGFHQASEGVTNQELKKLFELISQQRAQFAGELQSEVRQLGSYPQDSGSVAGALHRGWINIKSAVTKRDEHNILEECERGEDSAVRNYEEALEEDLPQQIMSLVQRQYTAIRETHDQIRSLRDKTRTARI